MKCLLCNKNQQHEIGGQKWHATLKYCISCNINVFGKVPKYTKEDILSLARLAKEEKEIQDNFEELNNL